VPNGRVKAEPTPPRLIAWQAFLALLTTHIQRFTNVTPTTSFGRFREHWPLTKPTLLSAQDRLGLFNALRLALLQTM